MAIGRRGMAAAFQPKGELVATGSSDGNIRLIDAATGDVGREVSLDDWTPFSHSDAPFGGVAFHPSGDVIKKTKKAEPGEDFDDEILASAITQENEERARGFGERHEEPTQSFQEKIEDCDESVTQPKATLPKSKKKKKNASNAGADADDEALLDAAIAQAQKEQEAGLGAVAGTSRKEPNVSTNGKRRFIRTANKERYEAVVSSLYAGVDKNALVGMKCGPLHIAAFNGHEAIVSYLLEAGENKNATTQDGATPLIGAALKGHKEVVSALLAAGADKNAAKQGGVTPMYIAAQNGHEAVVSALLAAGADRNVPTPDGFTRPALLAAGADKKAAD